MSGEISAAKLAESISKFDSSLLSSDDLDVRKLAMIYLLTSTKMIFVQLQQDSRKNPEKLVPHLEIRGPFTMKGNLLFLTNDRKLSKASEAQQLKEILNSELVTVTSRHVLSYTVVAGHRRLILGLDETRLAEVFLNSTILIGVPDPQEVDIFLNLEQFNRFLPHVQILQVHNSNEQHEVFRYKEEASIRKSSENSDLLATLSANQGPDVTIQKPAVSTPVRRRAQSTNITVSEESPMDKTSWSPKRLSKPAVDASNLRNSSKLRCIDVGILRNSPNQFNLRSKNNSIPRRKVITVVSFSSSTCPNSPLRKESEKTTHSKHLSSSSGKKHNQTKRIYDTNLSPSLTLIEETKPPAFASFDWDNRVKSTSVFERLSAQQLPSVNAPKRQGFFIKVKKGPKI